MAFRKFRAPLKEFDRKTTRSAFGCALQISWLPAICYAQHAEWVGLPIENATPLASYFAAALLTVVCIMLSMPKTLENDDGRTLDIGAVVAYAFGIAILLSSTSTEKCIPIDCIALALVGCSSGIGVLQWERCLTCLRPNQVAIVAITAAFAACVVIFAMPSLPFWIALIASLVCVTLSCISRPKLEYPAKDPSAIDSKLLRAKMRSFDRRAKASMFLLGAASTVPIALFSASDISFIGNSVQAATSVAQWAFLAFAFFALIVIVGWLPHREASPFGSLRALFAIALLTFFPLSPGSEFNMWLVLVFSMVWVVSLAGVTLLVACEIDREYAKCGRFVPGRCVAFICIGVLAGIAIVAFVKNFIPQFTGVVGRSSDGTMLVCSISMACVMLLFLATNTLITKDMLHEVALFGRGKLAFHVPDDAANAHEAEKHRSNETAAANAALDDSIAADQCSRKSDDAKKPTTFVTTCKSVALNYGLTPRELEVLIILAQGNTLARVQEELVISEGTAITHRRNVYRKLGVHSKQELIDFVRKQ